MERADTNDSGKQGLMMHWIFTGLGWVALFTAAGYSQFFLTKMYFAKNVRVMMLDHPHMVSGLISVGTLWSLVPLLKAAAWVPVPCPAYILITQICGTIIISTIVYRTLKFTYRMARVQSCKQYMLDEKSDEKEKKRFEEEKQFVKTVFYLLQGKRSMHISIGIFTFGFSTMFIDPYAIKQLMDQTNSCNMRTSTYLVVGWMMFVVPYLLYLRRFQLIDPYRIFYKLKVITVSMWILILLYVLGDITLPDLIGSSHWSLMGNHLLFSFLVILWYCESWIPLQLTKKSMTLAEADTSNMHKLIDTIANPVLLHKFEQHLIGEWSHETLQFYKQAVLFQIDATEIYRQRKRWFCQNVKGSAECMKKLKVAAKDLMTLRRRARKIYEDYIMEDAENQVNLSKGVVKPLHDFFTDDHFLHFERVLEDSSVTSRSEQCYGESSRLPSQDAISTVQIGYRSRVPSHPCKSREQIGNNASSKSIISDVATSPDDHKKRIAVLSDSNSITLRPLSERKSRLSQGCDEKSRLSLSRTKRRSSVMLFSSSPNEKRLTSKYFCKTLISAMSRDSGIAAEGSVMLRESRFSLTSTKVPIVVKEIKHLSTKFNRAKKATFELMETDSHRRFRLALKHEEGLHRV
ncbi:hypothetical protein AAMO2058_001372300 [Amorphochlora amoebiformis]